MRAPFWAAIAALALTVAPSVALAQGAGQGVDAKFRGPVKPTPPFNPGDTIVWDGVAWIASAGPSSGAVPTSRTISATSPLRIDGGASADLSANRTLSILVGTNNYVIATVGGVVVWTDPATLVPVTLQAAYNGGKTITTSGGNVSISSTATDGFSLLGLTKNPSGPDGGHAVVTTMGANASGDAFQALMLTGASGFAFRARDNAGATTWSVNAAGTFMTLGGATSAFPAIKRSGTILEIRNGDDSAYGTVNLAIMQAPTGQLQVGTFTAQDFILYTSATARLTLISDGGAQFASTPSSAVGAAGTGKLIYNNSTGTMQVSLNGAAYVNLATGTPTLQSVAVAGRTYDGTSGAVRLYNASTGSTNALTLNDESAAGVGLKYVSNTGESAGVCMELWTGNTGARASFWALYSKATDGFEVPNGQSLLNASLNLNSGSTIVWRDATDVFSGANDLRLRRSAAKTLTLDDATAGAVTFDHVGRIAISGAIATVSAAGAVAFRNNAGVAEVSQNGGAYSPITTTASQLWTRTGTQLAPTTANDDVNITTNSAVTSVRTYNVGSGFGVSTYAAANYAQSIASDIAAMSIMQSTVAFAANVGPYQDWSGLIDGVSGQSTFGRDQFAKENSTSGNTASFWRVYTRTAGGSITEAIRATSEKAFQISASTGSALSAAGTIAFRSNAGAAEVSQNGGAWAALSTGASGWTDSGTIVATTTATDRVQIGASAPGSDTILRVTGDATRTNLVLDAGSGGSSIFRENGGANLLTVDASGVQIAGASGVSNYKGVATAGWGVPAIYAATEITAQSGNATIASYTLGAADGDVDVSATCNVTARTGGSFTLQVLWTDKANNSRQMDFPVMAAGGTSGTFLASGAIASTGDYSTPVMHLRCKASTSVTILVPASGTFIGVTYSASAVIKQTR